MSGFSLRPANAADAAELAILDDIASHGLASWLWFGGVVSGQADTPMERGRQLMGSENIDWGYKGAYIAETDDRVAGMAISYLMDMTWPPTDMGEKANKVLNSSFELMHMANGNWYLDGLAVFRQFQRTGLGRQLVVHTMERARAAKAPAISLITDSSNARALGLYQSCGFEIKDQRPYVPFGRRTDIENWVLLTAPLT